MDIASIANHSGPPIVVALPNSYVVVPCIFFWLVVPVIVYDCKKSRFDPLGWSTIMSLKWFVASLLIIDRLFVFLLAIWEALFEHKPVEASLVVYPFLHTFTLLALLIATNEVRRAGIHSSGALFCTWLLFALSAIPEFYQWMVAGSQPDVVAKLDFFRYVAYLTYFPLVVIEFALHLVSDPFPMPDYLKNPDCPQQNANFISRQLLLWFSQLISLGSKKTLVAEDLFELDKGLDQEYLNVQWEAAWKYETQRVHEKKIKISNKKLANNQNEKSPLLHDTHMYGSVQPVEDAELKKLQPSVIKTLWRINKWELIAGSILKLIADLLNFANPLILNMLINYIESTEEPQIVGIGLAVGLFAVGQVKSLLMNQYFIVMTRIGTRIQMILSCAVYKKALTLSNSVRRDRTVGEMVNLMAIDIERFRMITPQLQQYWSSPLQIIICMILLSQMFGWSVWAGIAIMISVIPFNFGISIITKKWQLRLMKYKDERIKLVNEVLNGIKVVKLAAWETAMQKKIEELRDKELRMIRISSLVKTIADCLNVGTPVLVAIATFAVFTLTSSENVLTPNIAFVSLSLFNLLRGPLMMAAELVAQTVQVVVSNKRIKTFLIEDEIEFEAVDRQLRGDMYKNSLEVHTGAFSWDKESNKQLADVNITIKSGDLVSVMGIVGSGKSSLLMALLGEMSKQTGYVGIRGSVAYLSQQPWILNQSLKKNILMQKEFNEKLYKTVIEACALTDDLKQLPDGDETEIGEKGINLSGGQKARIALARAVYQQKDVYFLDDPLSAVDAHVGKHIFDKVIGPNGLLSKTTRVFVTNITSFIKESDKIVILKEGRITHYDTYDNLESDDNAKAFIEEVSKQVERKKSEKSDDDESESEKESGSQLSKTSKVSSIKRKKSSVVKEDRKPKALITKEEAAIGRVKFGIYLRYFKSMGIFKYVVPYGLSLILNMAFAMSRSLWLSAWSDANIDPLHPDSMSLGGRLGIYTFIGISEIVFLFFSLSLLIMGGVAASKNLHRPLLYNVLRNPLSYFDVTPIGRIINRLAKDMEIVDLRLSSSFRFLFISFISLMQTTIIVSYSTPLFIFVIIPVFIIYYFILKHSIKSTRQLQRIASLTKSPIFSNFSETLQGISTIRAFDWHDEFIRRNNNYVNESVKASYYSQIANRWLAVRLELLGNIVIFSASLLAILGKESGLTPGMLGLSVTYSLNITFMLNMFVRQINEVETNVVSVERIDEYTKTQSEAQWRIHDNLPPVWPSSGTVTLTSYSCRYRNELDLVLKNINLNILPGQKVGVCGRTGAGKSSLALALFRIIEAAEGSIEIDKKDTSRMGLHDLRERLTIIPQENVLFANTLRFNIDPKNEFTDEQLWRALENANLKSQIENLPQKLESLVSEGGENFSLGERQLICLARALLRKSKVLVLDEATAGIDNQTDALVQATIRREFSDSTIITVAHRLHTILDYDRIIVMENGQIAEDGTPEDLLKNKNSKFYGLAKSAKIV